MPLRNTKKPPHPHPFYVVGLGASAGGMNPLLSFFKKMPHDTGMAFIVVQHLSPNFKSFMGELLKNVTSMPIHTVTEGMSLQPNEIYLIPPNHNMTINHHRFCLTTQKNHPRINYPIDLLFESLALNYKKKAIAVVLSGTGTDGSLGIKKIAAFGGLVLVESPSESKFPNMPDSAIASEKVDYIRPANQLADLIIQYTSNSNQINPRLNTHSLEYSPDHETLFNLMFNQHKLDLNQYKIRTVFRRINRRIQTLNLHTIQEYLTHVTNHPDELALLYKDLLIGVTLFFRDSEAFDVLERDIIPALFEHQKQTHEDIRVWCAACSTGEEAYSIAILLFEYAEKNKIPLKVKLFATDISTDFLNIASRGIYPEQAIHAITKTRLERYFFMEEAHYKISPMIRDMVIFVPHNLMSSPPFIKMDFITCRNFLIYVQPDMQKRILSFLHLGLNPSGFLFLGPNENISELAPFVEPISTTWKIYKKTRPLPTHFLFGHDGRHILSNPIPFMPSSTRTGTQHMNQYKTPKAGGTSLPMYAYQALIKNFIPCGFILDEFFNILHICGQAGEFIFHKDGMARMDLLSMISSQLKAPLSEALHRAKKNKAPVTYTGIEVNEHPGELKHLNVTVKPLLENDHVLYYCISFDACHEKPLPLSEPYHPDHSSRTMIQNLEEQLQQTAETLQNTIEELETTNEELLAANEELQSTNEELQSVNEVLYTSNTEHQKKILELKEANTNIDNLLRTTDIGAIFVDKSLNIRMFTPVIAQFFDLVQEDLTRSLKSFIFRANFPQLLEKIEWVIEQG